MKPQKPKKCKACGEIFQPSRPMQAACSVACALDLVKKTADEKERKEIKRAKSRTKTKAQHMREAQAAFNAWIRWRDRNDPCISCARYHEGQWHAGHYRTTAAAPHLRFDEQNVHKQCAPCNNYKSGDIVNYRKRLLLKIGQEAVEMLESHDFTRRYTVDDLMEIKKKYRGLLRECIKNMNSPTKKSKYKDKHFTESEHLSTSGEA